MIFKKISTYLFLFLKSIIIGICAILPGVSGSVVAVSFGIYQKFLLSLSNAKRNIPFFIVLFLGLIIGMYFTSGLILQILKYQTIIYYCLAGIILSEVPFILRKLNEKDSRGIMLIPFFISFVFSLVLDLLNKNSIKSCYSFIRFFIGGILFSFGKIFPGISSSFFLISLGIYGDIIAVILNPIKMIEDFYYYFPFIFGGIIGIIVFVILLKYLLNNRIRFLYSIILGFILSSTIILLPKFSFNYENIFGIILMILIFVLFTRIKNKNVE